MNIIDYHNYFRSRVCIIPSYTADMIVDENIDYLKLWIMSLVKGLPPLEENIILNEYALKASKWMARRGWNTYWNFDKTRNDLLKLGFEDIDFNVAVGEDENCINKHFLNNEDKRNKIFSTTFKYIGYGVSEVKYKYWTILYAR